MSASVLNSDKEPPLVALSALDRRIILATVSGLAPVPEPFALLAQQLDISNDELLARVERLSAHGILRRIGPVLNLQRIGYASPVVTVWDVEDSEVRRLGPLIGELDFVSHCLLRPRHLPQWPYNLFAVIQVHQERSETQLIAAIRQLLGEHCRGNDVLRRTRLLKSVQRSWKAEDLRIT